MLILKYLGVAYSCLVRRDLVELIDVNVSFYRLISDPQLAFTFIFLYIFQAWFVTHNLVKIKYEQTSNLAIMIMLYNKKKH